MNAAIDIIEAKWKIDEYEEDGKLCGYEIDTYTKKGVNQIIFLDFRDTPLNPKSLEDFTQVLKERIHDIDIDEEIDLNRQSDEYRAAFSISESLEDFLDWKDSLVNFVKDNFHNTP